MEGVVGVLSVSAGTGIGTGVVFTTGVRFLGGRPQPRLGGAEGAAGNDSSAA
jgi:hypothetical protein